MKSVLQDATDERLMLMLRALANPARLQLFHHLRTSTDTSCHQLVEALPLSQSTVSEHLQRLKDAGLIRGEPHGVPLALQRSLAHTAYHVGQIILIARVLAGDRWETITIPRGGSAGFNRRVWGESQPHPPGPDPK